MGVDGLYTEEDTPLLYEDGTADEDTIARQRRNMWRVTDRSPGTSSDGSGGYGLEQMYSEFLRWRQDDDT